MRPFFILSISLTLFYTSTASSDNVQGLSHMASAAFAVGMATGKLNALAGTQTGAAVAAEGQAKAAGPWASGFFYFVAATEAAAAVESFKDGRRTKRTGVNVSSDGNALNCINGVCTGVSGDSSMSDSEIFDSQSSFDQFMRDEKLDQVFGQLKNPQDILNELKEKGYDFNKDDNSLTTPDGRKITAADVKAAASGGGPASEGLKSLENTVRSLEKKQKKYLNLVQRFRSGQKGGYANGSASGRTGNAAKKPGFHLNFGLPKNGGRKPASAFGPVTYVKGDPISAQGDNLLHIVERSYEGLLQQKQLKIPKQKQK